MGIDQFKNVLLQVTGQRPLIEPHSAFSYRAFDGVVVDAMTGLYENPAPTTPSALVRRELFKIRDAVESGCAKVRDGSDTVGVSRFTFVYMTDIPAWVPAEKREIQEERRKTLVPYPADSVLESNCVFSASTAGAGGVGRVLLEPVRFFQTQGMTRLFSELVYKTFAAEVLAGHWDGFYATVVMDIGAHGGPYVFDLARRSAIQHETLVFPSGEAEVRAVWWLSLLSGDRSLIGPDGRVPVELDHSICKALHPKFLLWSTDQDMLACASVRMMRNPDHYRSVHVHWRFRDVQKETYTLEVHTLVHKLCSLGATPMFIVAFAAACGTDYTKKEHYSKNVSQSSTFDILTKAARGVTELADEHFQTYAEHLLNKFHCLCEEDPRFKNKHPVRFHQMEQQTHKTAIDRLGFLWLYWTNLRA
jgi:hypothetical protein